MIPKVIHYCWFGGNPIPTEMKKCIKSWEKMCPDYEIKRWDESNFDINEHPFVKTAYDAKAWAFVSDYVRLKVIFDYGGIYLDTDVELLKSLDSLLDYKCYVGIQQSEHLCNTGLGFGAEKSNQIVQQMLKQYDGLTFSVKNKTKIACPYLNHKVICQLGYSYVENPVVIKDVMILSPKYLDPYAPGKDQKNLKCNDTISIHHYSASWMDKKTIFRRKIIQIIGPEAIDIIKRYKRKILHMIERYVGC